MTAHRPDGGARTADRCVCGAEIVYFDPPLLDRDGVTWTEGYGCSAFGRATRAFAVKDP